MRIKFETHNKLVGLLALFALLFSTLSACGGGIDLNKIAAGQAATGEEAQAAEVVSASEAAVGAEPAATTPVAQITAQDLVESVAGDVEDHEDARAEVAERAESVAIVLDGDAIAVDGEGATIDGRVVTITAPGTYNLAGSLADGQVIVDVPDGLVGLVLNGVDISSATGPAIYILEAQEAVIVLADGTENHVSDGTRRTNEGAEDEPTAVIFAMADLTISGSGSLSVEGNYQDGITSKDGLVLAGGAITVRAPDDGIRGKDYLIVQSGQLMVDAGGDGCKSDSDEDTTHGYVRIEDGSLDITAGGDAIEAQTVLMVTGGQLSLTSGGGHTSFVDDTVSAKGIKGVSGVAIDGGTFTIDSADDAIHSNGSITIDDGTFLLSTGDDGLHADTSLEINGGDIRVTNSYEGLESAAITINDGVIHVVASDDGINAAGGNDGSGFVPGPGRGGGRGQMPGTGQSQFPGGGQGQMPGGGQGGDAFATGDYYLHINGGYVAVDAHGDGLDVNGPIEMTGGVVLVNGPVENMNGALDYLGQFNITGGFLVAAGSAGMAQAPSTSSGQYSLLLNLNGTVQAGTLAHIQASGGEQVLTFAPTKQYQSLVFSSSELESGGTYHVYLGGSSDGEVTDGLYQAGSYTSGTEYTNFTLSSVVTWIGGRAR